MKKTLTVLVLVGTFLGSSLLISAEAQEKAEIQELRRVLRTIDVAPQEEAKPQDQEKADPEKKAGEEKKAGTTQSNDDGPTISVPKIVYPPTFMRFQLLDGDVVSGELSKDSISILTDFGTLSVPIEKIVRFEPGLNSYPQRVQKIESLVQQLGSDKYEERELAHKQLVGYGIKIQGEIARFADDGNAERKRHLGEIRKKIEAMVEELDEEDLEDPANHPWVRHDQLVMPTFTAVGKIQETSFQMKNRYGDLTINLSDIRNASRPVNGRPDMNKNLAVNQKNFVQLEFKSAGLTLEKGDQVSVSATGNLIMSPWGSSVSSTPNGTPQYGVMPNTPGIPYGALVAKIGKSGKYFKIGDKKKFRAKASGKLYFGITMRSSYVGKSYQFPGEYKLKIKVSPETE